MKPSSHNHSHRRFSLHTGQWHDGAGAISQDEVPAILTRLEEEARALPNRCRELAEWQFAGIQGLVLDVGCGTGWKVRCMNQWPGTRVFGCDMEERVLMYGRQSLGIQDLVLALGERLPFPASVFDWVTASEVIEHLEHPRGFLDEAWRVLKPNGRLLLTTPNRLQYFRPWRPRLFWYALRGRVVLDASHYREFSSSELKDALAPRFAVAETRFLGTLCGWPTKIPIRRLPSPVQRLWAQGIQVTALKLCDQA